MKLNPDLVQTRCQEITESVDRLAKLGAMPLPDFLADQDACDIACYRLLVAIEAAIGLCYHVTAKQLRKVPEEYAECFALLGEAGIIPEELGENLQRMARFRNLLVHMYWKVDHRAVHGFIRERLQDLPLFCRRIVALL